MSDKTYDSLRFICDRLLPALGTLYFALTQFIPLPYPEAVVGTITALVCFGDEILNYFKVKYNKAQDDALWAQMTTGSGDDWKGVE